VQRIRTVGFISLGRSLTFDWNSFARSNLPGRSFEAKGIELAEGKGGQQFQTTVDLLRHQPERSELFLL